MSSPVLPPSPCLLGILLIIKTKAGAIRIFHYPPNPGSDKPQLKFDHEVESDEDASASSDDDVDHDSAEEDQASKTGTREERPSQQQEKKDYGTESPEKTNGHFWTKPNFGRPEFLGLPPGLENMLSPPRSANKKRFELMLDGLVFLGRPTFSRSDGGWRRKRKKRTYGGGQSASEAETKKTEDEESNREHRQSKRNSEGDRLDLESSETEPGEENGEMDLEAPREALHVDSQMNGSVTDGRAGLEKLNMFHVVFVMSPPPLEYQTRVDDMYVNVVKKFSRALKIEQSRSGFVSTEAEKLRRARAKHESVPQMLRRSSLAKAISVLYTSIATSRIAHVTLTPSFSFSLQIPLPTSVSALQPTSGPQVPGLWLTTATSIPTTDDTADLHNSRSKLAAHFALLLLSDLPTILADLSATPSSLSQPLAHYLRVTTPTKSFSQISQSSGIPLNMIQYLASHLIYWRRARAVPPLHQKDTYIVSPNADIRRLRSASIQYAKLFPALPTLPKMLGLMSTASRPYSTYIPSKDHKQTYMEILAWLLRGGWVTQLRTFAWVKIPTRIRIRVAREMEAEARAEEIPEHDEKLDVDSKADDKEDDNKSNSDLSDRSLSLLPDSSISDASSVSSTRTAIPLNMQSSLTSLVANTHPPILILHPTRATGVESRYLAAVAREMESMEVPLASKASTGLNSPLLTRRESRASKGRRSVDEGDGRDEARPREFLTGKEVRGAWEKCLKYFNGEHALEKIAVREGWKRKRVDALRAAWASAGVLLEARHW